jgi:transposase
MNFFAGIDWADTKHDICILNLQGQIVTEFIISDDPPGFRQLHTILQTFPQVQLLIERPEGRLVNFLLQHRWPVYFIPPNISAAQRPRRSKTDRGDAYLLAMLLKNNHPDCRLIQHSSGLCDELRQVVRTHDRLHRELQRLALQLRYQLKQYYPAILKVFRKPQQPLTYAFLTAFPDPAAFQTLPFGEFQAFFVQQRYRYRERVAHHWEVFRQESALTRPTRGYQLAAAATMTLMTVLDQQLRQLKREMGCLFQQHPDAVWWQSFPGLGVLNAARLLVEVGDNRLAFPDVESLRTRAGTVPITRSSGKRRSVHFRRDCSRPLRKAFTDLAMNSKKKSAWAKSYFDAQIVRGHSRPRANRALANRWAGIVWKLWQTGDKYDEQVHQSNRQKGIVQQLVN